MSDKLKKVQIEEVVFWAIVTYELGTISYFTGLFRAGAPYISPSVHEAAQYNTRQEAERAVRILPTNDWAIEQHLIYKKG